MLYLVMRVQYQILLDIYFNIFHDSKIYDLSLALGNQLVLTAVKEEFGWSWDHRANNVTSIRYHFDRIFTWRGWNWVKFVKLI